VLFLCVVCAAGFDKPFTASNFYFFYNITSGNHLKSAISANNRVVM